MENRAKTTFSLYLMSKCLKLYFCHEFCQRFHASEGTQKLTPTQAKDNRPWIRFSPSFVCFGKGYGGCFVCSCAFINCQTFVGLRFRWRARATEQPSNRPAELRIGAFHQLFLCSQNIFKILKLIVLTILPLNVVRSTDAFEMHEWIENCFGFFSRIFSCLTFPYC